MAAVSQRLVKRGVKMVEYPQSVPNITEASTNLYELIKAGNLVVYPDEDMRLAIQRAVALEVPRGWKITKEKSAHKIDIVVALGMAALGAVEGGVRRGFDIPEAALAASRVPGPGTQRHVQWRFGGEPMRPGTAPAPFGGFVGSLNSPTPAEPSGQTSWMGSVSLNKEN